MPIASKHLKPEQIEKVKEYGGGVVYVGPVWMGLAELRGSRITPSFSHQSDYRFAWTAKGVAVMAYQLAVDVMKSACLDAKQAKEALAEFQSLVGDLEVREAKEPASDGKVEV